MTAAMLENEVSPVAEEAERPNSVTPVNKDVSISLIPTPSLEKLLTKTVSTPVNVNADISVSLVAPAIDRFNVSLPRPPTITSPACAVVPVAFAATRVPENVSSPAVPVMASVLAVSDQVEH